MRKTLYLSVLLFTAFVSYELGTRKSKVVLDANSIDLTTDVYFLKCKQYTTAESVSFKPFGYTVDSEFKLIAPRPESDDNVWLIMIGNRIKIHATKNNF